MATVHKATLDLFEEIYPLILADGIEDMGRAEWFELLSKRWSSAHDHFGYVLVDEGQVVGFLGAFFCERNVNGRQFFFAICSVGMSWRNTEGKAYYSFDLS